MNLMTKKNNTSHVNTIEFEHLMLEVKNGEHIVTLVDAQGYKIISGYGNSAIEAINDMHHNLV